MTLLTNRARSPILSPQLIEDRATHTYGGIRAELVVGRPIATQGIEQADEPDLLHVVAIERAAGLRQQLAHDSLHARHALEEIALLFCGIVPRSSRIAGRAFCGDCTHFTR